LKIPHIQADMCLCSSAKVIMTYGKSKVKTDSTQLNRWLYETRREELTMAEILEQGKQEAANINAQSMHEVSHL
jgi:hypothetical protein